MNTPDSAVTAEKFLGPNDYARMLTLASDPEASEVVRIMASAVADGNPEGLEKLLERFEEHQSLLEKDEQICWIVLRGMELGTAQGSGRCANFLGACYYMGNYVEQDYFRAKELYELAQSKGSVRAVLNLGYIYEYGRCGVPDYEASYRQYALACALGEWSEALYKMGDAYNRGHGVARDSEVALALYRRSYEATGDDVAQKSHAAFRLAELISDPESPFPCNLLEALKLYQEAELGLRIEIRNGQAFYEDQLGKAVQGQNRVREMLDNPLLFE